MIQWYRWSSYPDEDEDGDIGVQPGEAGVDYFIGEQEMIGGGAGPLMIGLFLDQVVLCNPDVTGVRTSVYTSTIDVLGAVSRRSGSFGAKRYHTRRATPVRPGVAARSALSRRAHELVITEPAGTR